LDSKGKGAREKEKEGTMEKEEGYGIGGVGKHLGKETEG